MSGEVTQRGIRLWLGLALSLALCFQCDAATYETTAPRDANAVQEALDPALMCMAIYGDAAVAGWHGPENGVGSECFLDEKTGLHAGIYWREHEAVVAFAGTELSSFQDLLTDVLQACGEVPEQYRQAVAVVRTVSAAAIKRGATLRRLTGHSLGGGLATFAGLATGLPATCFATAPLGPGAMNYLAEAKVNMAVNSTQISHYFVSGDPIQRIPGLTGCVWPGRTMKPDLLNASEAPSATPSLRLAKLLVTGLVLKKTQSGTMNAASQAMVELERHRMSTYVGSLAALLETPGQFSPVGYWRSQKGFFQLGASENIFSIQRNGTFTIRSAFWILEPSAGLGFRIGDGGLWTFSSGVLHLNFPTVGTLTYKLQGAAPGKVVEWRRTDARTNDEALLASLSQGKEGEEPNSQSAKATLLLVKGAMILLKNKPVTWVTIPPEEMCNQP